MRKTKTPRRSRIIRKWDGTPVAENEPVDQGPTASDASTGIAQGNGPAHRHDELSIDFNQEDELTDSVGR